MHYQAMTTLDGTQRHTYVIHEYEKCKSNVFLTRCVPSLQVNVVQVVAAVTHGRAMCEV